MDDNEAGVLSPLDNGSRERKTKAAMSTDEAVCRSLDTLPVSSPKE